MADRRQNVERGGGDRGDKKIVPVRTTVSVFIPPRETYIQWPPSKGETSHASPLSHGRKLQGEKRAEGG